MADSLFSMYCGLRGISGMDEELTYTSNILEASEGKPSIALIYMNGTREWVFGHCNFRHEPDHVANFKFSNTFEALKDQGVFPALIRAHRVLSILTDDEALARRLRADGLTSRFADLVHLVKKQGDQFERTREEAQSRSFWTHFGLGS